jgi:hypothetical protein
MFGATFAASCRIDKTDLPGALTKTVSLAEGGKGVLSLAQGEHPGQWREGVALLLHSRQAPSNV